jgi:hypothetical protein
MSPKEHWGYYGSLVMMSGEHIIISLQQLFENFVLSILIRRPLGNFAMRCGKKKTETANIGTLLE